MKTTIMMHVKRKDVAVSYTTTTFRQALVISQLALPIDWQINAYEGEVNETLTSKKSGTRLIDGLVSVHPYFRPCKSEEYANYTNYSTIFRPYHLCKGDFSQHLSVVSPTNLQLSL